MELIDVDDIEQSCPVSDPGINDDCPLCVYGATKNPVFIKMDQLQQSLTGRVNPDEIYKNLYQLYVTEMKVPLERQGMSCPHITVDHIKKHYTYHKLNDNEIINNDILTINIMQAHLRDAQIASRKQDGMKTYNLKCVEAYIKLSKHKMDLMKYLKSTKTQNTQANKLKPYEFT